MREPSTFASIAGWAEDDHEAALAAFLVSAACWDERAAPTEIRDHLLNAAASARGNARNFFEQFFSPQRVHSPDGAALLTGYFEPEVAASRSRTPLFSTPLHARPPDLETVVAESDRGSVTVGHKTHMRRTACGLVAMPTRREIDLGALSDGCEELFYVADDIDRFIIQVQGSAALRLPSGERVRVTYDGKNGHPYTSLGKYLIEAGELRAEEMSLDVLVAWLKADLARARDAIWRNESYVFFRELPLGEASAPIGVMGTPLVAGRSLAVDPAHNALGMPIFVSAPQLAIPPDRHFRRLMIAHDVGSAIKGRVRGDVFVGTGDDAGRIAGAIKHPVEFFALRPKVPSSGSRP